MSMKVENIYRSGERHSVWPVSDEKFRARFDSEFGTGTEANGVFSSYYQFCKRMHPLEMNRRALESLIKSGALDGLEDHYNRRQMLSAVGEIIDHLDADKRKNLDGQIGFFDIPDDPGKKEEFFIAPQPELSPSDKLAMEKETTGMYLSGIPWRITLLGMIGLGLRKSE